MGEPHRPLSLAGGGLAVRQQHHFWGHTKTVLVKTNLQTIYDHRTTGLRTDRCIAYFYVMDRIQKLNLWQYLERYIKLNLTRSIHNKKNQLENNQEETRCLIILSKIRAIKLCV